MNNPTDHPVHDLISGRWSPYRFDPAKPVSTDALRSLFEAARWSMSSYNAQPWRYIVANRGTDESLWQRVLDVLLAGNKPWAQYAPVLALGLAEHHFEHNGQTNKGALHDLGAASAFLTLQATAHGLSVHQMIGIDPPRVRERFALPESIEPLTALAIGYVGSNEALDEEYVKRDARERQRKPLDDIILHGKLL